LNQHRFDLLIIHREYQIELSACFIFTRSTATTFRILKWLLNLQKKLPFSLH